MNDLHAITERRGTLDLQIFIFMGLSLFASNFLRSADFGLYEDDLIYFIGSFNHSPLWSEAKSAITTFFQGRPLNHLMQMLCQFVIYQTRSLLCAYITFCSMLAIGIYTWFKVFNQKLDVQTSALSSLLTFLLPLHTLTAFLNGAVAFSLATILSGSAIILINRRGRITQIGGYLCAALTLMTYELFFPLIYAGALLSKRWIGGAKHLQSFVLPLLIQATILTVILICYTLFREHMGQRTASTLVKDNSVTAIMYDIARADLNGAIGSFRYPWAIFQPRYLTWENIALGVVVGSITVLGFQLVTNNQQNSANDRNSILLLLEGLVAACALVVLGFAFTYFATGGLGINLPLSGRESRFNIASVLGHGLLVGISLTLLWSFTRGWSRFTLQAAFLFPIIIVLTINRIGVQSDYSSVWAVTKEEVRQIVLLTPDATLGTGIILEAGMDIYHRAYPPLPAIGSQPHGYNFILGALFEAPREDGIAEKSARLDRAPLVQRVGGPTWPTGLKAADAGLLRNTMWTADWTWPETTFEPGNIIHLKEDNMFHLKRIDDQVWIEGVEIIKPKPVDPLKHGFWDTARQRPALVHLMPVVAFWFSHYQSSRAQVRAAPVP